MNLLRTIIHRIRVRRAAEARKRALTVAAQIKFQDAAQAFIDASTAVQAGYEAAQAAKAKCHIAKKQPWFCPLIIVQLTWPDMVASYGLN